MKVLFDPKAQFEPNFQGFGHVVTNYNNEANESSPEEMIGKEAIAHAIGPVAAVASNIGEMLESFKGEQSGKVMVTNNPNVKDQLNPSKAFKPS